MALRQLDRIVALEEGVSITAVKALTLAEEYLQDHFPRFPVMPGVLMLEAMYQASAWLVRKSEDFAYSAVVLKEARSVKYADFVEPGQQLMVTAQILKQDAQTTVLKSQGLVNDAQAVSGRLVLERFNFGDRFPERKAFDEYSRIRQRKEFELLYAPHARREPVS